MGTRLGPVWDSLGIPVIHFGLGDLDEIKKLNKGCDFTDIGVILAMKKRGTDCCN